MPRTQLLSKRQSETHIVEFEFREQLTFGESLSTPVVTVGVFTGFDYDTAALLSGGATVSGTVVSQLVTAGMAGAIYSLTCEVTGSSGNVYRTTRRLAVLSDVGGFAAGALPSLTGSLPDGVVGAPYLEMLAIAGGYPPYSPEGIIAGAPSWMGFSVLDDVLVCAGTPDETVATTYNFSPEIFDQALNHAVSPQSIDITRIIVAGAAPDSTVGSSVDFFYTADFGTPPYSFPTQPVGFPPTWTLGSDGHVTGTSTVEGSYSWEVLGVDANGITDTHPDDADVTVAPVDLLYTVGQAGGFLPPFFGFSDVPITTLASRDAGGSSVGDNATNSGTFVVNNKLFLTRTGNLTTCNTRVSDDAFNFNTTTGIIVTEFNSAIRNMFYQNGQYIAIANSNTRCWRSPDGLNFTPSLLIVPSTGQAAVLDSTLLVGGNATTPPNVHRSLDSAASFILETFPAGIRGYEPRLGSTNSFFVAAAQRTDFTWVSLSSASGLTGSWNTPVVIPDQAFAGDSLAEIRRLTHNPSNDVLLGLTAAGRCYITSGSAGSWIRGTDIPDITSVLWSVYAPRVGRIFVLAHKSSAVAGYRILSTEDGINWTTHITNYTANDMLTIAMKDFIV